MFSVITSDTIGEKKGIGLEDNTETDGYQLGWASIICTGDYAFIVGSHYRDDAPEAKEWLLPVIERQISRTIAARNKNTLPSLRKCHAATGAERR